jgi:hypothetical protein
MYVIYGLEVRPGDVLGRIQPGSAIEHEFLVGFDGAIAHVPDIRDVFRSGMIDDVLNPGGRLRVTRPTRSLEESEFRFARAKEIMGTSWWSMNCHEAMDYVVGAPPTPWLT